MKKKVVFSCSCFIDQSVWFVNSTCCFERFDAFLYVNDVISADVFIYEKKSTSVTSEIIVCCLECFEFLLTCLSMEDEFIDLLNKMDCLYVVEEAFCYNSFIYIGNHRFINQNYDEHEFKSTRDILEKHFIKFPSEESCFSSLQKYYYGYFCFSCKEIFKRFFLQKMHCLEK